MPILTMKRSLAAVFGLLALPVAADPVTVPFDGEYEPFSFVKEAEPAGFDIDVAKALAAQMGVEIDFQSSDFYAIQSGNWPEGASFAVASISKSPDREPRFEFVGPYYYDTVVLVSRDDGQEGFTAPEAGARIGVCRGCIYGPAISGGYLSLNPAAEIAPSEITLLEFGTDTDAVQQLLANDESGVDFAVTSAHVAERFIDAGFPVEMSTYQLFVTPVWIVVPKDDMAALEAVTEAYEALRDGGKLEPLWNTYVRRDYINPINALGLD